MIDYEKLMTYRPGTFPVGGPDSLQPWAIREFQRLSVIIGQQNDVIRDLNTRLAALEP